jgi:hypothetical protein
MMLIVIERLNYYWGDSESSLPYTKNKRMSLVAQVPMRKA